MAVNEISLFRKYACKSYSNVSSQKLKQILFATQLLKAILHGKAFHSVGCSHSNHKILKIYTIGLYRNSVNPVQHTSIVGERERERDANFSG